MTTHVFIVDENTFKYHLEYLFAGTGSKDNFIDFNNSETSTLHHSIENALIGMMADGCRVRKDDLIIFYVQATKEHEGLFFGIFQAIEDGIFLDNFGEKQFLKSELKKSLTFRLKIKPYEVYEKGVTEWTALDEIKKIQSPCQMLWSLIYRKLKGNRGNTMITIYESERLINLIRCENNNIALNCENKGISYDSANSKIVIVENKKTYNGVVEKINIVPRFIKKYSEQKAHEAHLQMYITQNIGKGTNVSLDESLGIFKNIEWIGNEVSCGVGMQRIDVMVSVNESETKRILYPIELKAVPAYADNTRQILRYIDWIEQYYLPNRMSVVQPVLICKKKKMLSKELKENFKSFNDQKRFLNLIYIEYEVKNNSIIFSRVDYTK